MRDWFGDGDAWYRYKLLGIFLKRNCPITNNLEISMMTGSNGRQ